MDILNHRYYAKYSTQVNPSRAGAITITAIFLIYFFKAYLPHNALTEGQQSAPIYYTKMNCLGSDQTACTNSCLSTQQFQLGWKINEPTLTCGQAIIDTASEFDNVSLENMVIQSIKRIPAF